jgi:CBS domain containing-hemolysin-like protein
MDVGTVVLKLFATILLVFLNSFFVASEFALVRVRRTQLEPMRSDSRAKRARYAVEHLDLYLAATQLGVTMASLGLGWLGEPALGGLIAQGLAAAHLPQGAVWVGVISVILAFALITTLHIVIGELAPKTLALARPAEVMGAVLGPLGFFTALFRWAIWGLNRLGNLAVRWLGLPEAADQPDYSEEELKRLLEDSERQGVLESGEQEMLSNVLKLADTPVRSVMTPRVEMVCARGDLSLDAFVSIYEQAGYSRIPIYKESIDQIEGLVYTRDLIRYHGKLGEITARQIAHPAHFVPDSMRVINLFQAMKERKNHMVIVVDEFGGTAGLVTLEDILEEIVGEIYDETDEEEEKPYQVLGEGRYRIDAGMPIDECLELLGIAESPELEEGDFDTLSGFLNWRFGRIAMVGESVEFGGWRFTVAQGDDRRIDRVQVERISQEGGGEGGDAGAG